MATAYVEEAFVALLSGLAPVYCDVAEQGAAAPFIVLRHISGSSIEDADGPDDKKYGTYQVDAYAADPSARATLARLLRQTLTGHSGVVTIGGNTINIDRIYLRNVRSDIENEGNHTAFYRSSMDFFLTWDEE